MLKFKVVVKSEGVNKECLISTHRFQLSKAVDEEFPTNINKGRNYCSNGDHCNFLYNSLSSYWWPYMAVNHVWKQIPKIT